MMPSIMATVSPRILAQNTAGVRVRFGAVVFLAAFLLFLAEPIAAKQLLPVLGGSSSVWITCLVFFQSALLAGYLYAHWLARRPDWKGYVSLLALAAVMGLLWAYHTPFPESGERHPSLAVFNALGEWIGVPFVLLAATSPLMQVWWARLQAGPVPYRLYALSNLASLLSLALYPTLVEPYLSLRAQRGVWAGGVMLFAILSAELAFKTRGAQVQPGAAGDCADLSLATASRAAKALWVLLPMPASMLLSAVTVHLTANIAAIPLLWIVPLAAYLLSLIVAFQFPGLLRGGILVRLVVLVLASIGYMLVKVDYSWPIALSIPFFVAALFLVCLYLHAQAYALRPARASESTLFYLLFAAGGALGSLLIGVVSPMVFRFNYDLPLTFLVTAGLALAANWRGHWSQKMLWAAASAAMAAVVVMVHIAYQHDTTVAVRNFYGALRVTQDEYSVPGTTVRTLLNGSIQHGTQIFGSDELRHTPTTYYAPDSGIGYALRFCCTAPDGSFRPRAIGVIGLGAGTIAAYGRPGDRIRFYEINPAVEPIARNVFTYMRESGASSIEVIPGDARTSLERSPSQGFDVLAIDAFSGDAIPLHLLTTQAMALYRRHLAQGGVLAFHISNQHVNLAPAIALLAASVGMQARRISSMANEPRGEFNSTWVLVSDNSAFFAQPEVAAHSYPIEPKAGLRLWTDDYSALLPVLRW
jgi:hypothetical protein